MYYITLTHQFQLSAERTFFEVTEEELSEIQKEMCRRVEALRFPELPGVQLKLVTAGTSIPGRVEEMLEQVRI